MSVLERSDCIASQYKPVINDHPMWLYELRTSIVL